ncbi:MAG: prepilin-type N-terminal cleavage/methylation domain-containing protein, partial [Planctomycetes bacterium]|nr:prepilin-type N-terminal cleavage/methylation domain-containing protein [Planctomycetota bacterium]
MNNRRHGEGFTLAELMVVIMVIALLVAIVTPFVQRAFAVQRKVACASHLEKLGQAVYTRFASAQTSDLASATISPATWASDLSSYIGESKGIFICPEDKGAETRKRSSARDQLKQMYIEVFDSDAHLGQDNHHLWDVPLDEEFASEWVWRLSEEQFRDFLNTPG